MKNEVVTAQPLALLAKLAGVLVALLGACLIRHPPATDRVVLVLVPGVTLEELRTAVGRGGVPNAAAVVESGMLAPVDAGASISGLTFWRRVLAEGGPSHASLGVGGEEKALWSGLGGRRTAVGVPDVLFPGLEGRRGPAAAHGGEAFAGDGEAVAVAARDLFDGRLPAPFVAAADAVKAAAPRVEPGKCSGWLEVGRDDSARFQILRGQNDEFLLSPVYRTRRIDTIPPSDVVIGDPFIAPVDAGLRPALLQHLVAVDETRALAVERLLQSSDETKVLVYAFTLAASAGRMSEPEGQDPSTRSRVLDVLEERLGKLAAALGSGGLMVLVGGPSLSRETSASGWCLASSGDGPSLQAPPLDLAGLARLVRYLLGVPLDAKEREAVPPSVRARYPRRAGTPAQAPQTPESGRTYPWSAESLDSLAPTPGS